MNLILPTWHGVVLLLESPIGHRMPDEPSRLCYENVWNPREIGPWWTFKYTDSDLSVGTYYWTSPKHHPSLYQISTAWNFRSALLRLWAVQIHLITIEVCVVGVAVHLCFLEVYPQSRGNNERRHSIHYPRSNTANILKEVPDKNSSLRRSLMAHIHYFRSDSIQMASWFCHENFYDMLRLHQAVRKKSHLARGDNPLAPNSPQPFPHLGEPRSAGESSALCEAPKEVLKKWQKFTWKRMGLNTQQKGVPSPN